MATFVKKCTLCGICDHIASGCWADIAEMEENDDTDTKKHIQKKCEFAVLQWAKNKKVSTCNIDEEIICNRCSSPFIFNVLSKKKYEEKGWKSPKICKSCSQMRYKEC